MKLYTYRDDCSEYTGNIYEIFFAVHLFQPIEVFHENHWVNPSSLQEFQILTKKRKESFSREEYLYAGSDFIAWLDIFMLAVAIGREPFGKHLVSGTFTSWYNWKTHRSTYEKVIEICADITNWPTFQFDIKSGHSC